jgi:NADH-quinone oxidoreductase subunit L
MLDFQAHPGLYFVAATLLPLASFLLILLFCGVWAVVRRYETTWKGGEAFFQVLDAPAARKAPAYVAVAAIAGSFLLSLTGFVIYNTNLARTHLAISEMEKRIHDLEHEREQLKESAGESSEEREKTADRLKQIPGDIAAKRKDIVNVEKQLEAYPERWKGHFDWLRLKPAGLKDADRGTVLQLGYSIDSLAAIMFVMVTLVATLIHLFSIGYMADEEADTVDDHHVYGGHHHAVGTTHEDLPEHALEPGHYRRRGRFSRFFMYLSLFCFSMLNLILTDNLFQIFISWELVGICSYLLIGFYFERTSASNAANKAFITNRIGDAGFIVGLLIIWSYIGTFNFNDIFARMRSPEKDSHGHYLKLGGQIVRANPESEANETGQQMRITTPGEEPGSQAVLFPRTLPRDFHALGPQVEGHEHEGMEGEKHEEEEEHRASAVGVRTFTAAANPRPTDYTSMPYWLLVLAGLGIFCGCVGKSAQFPLQVWLPDAMEGPTPVSALIHAATMVAAGVYLVGRCYPLFTPEVLLVIAYVGVVTLFVAATIAVVMTDIKKVLAYSTVSQLGYMMLGLGVGGWVAGLFHLLTHAFFKALLFLGSGSVILGCHHEQEMTKMGGLWWKMRITALTMLMGVLAIAGTPGFSGWYSKDALLASAAGFAWVHREHALLFIIPLFTAGITGFYMFRLWLMTFTGKPRDEEVYRLAHESPQVMTVPLIVLAIFSVCVAWPWHMPHRFFASKFPFLDPTNSIVEHNLHWSQPRAVIADYGAVHDLHENWPHEVSKPEGLSERHWAHEYHDFVGWMALGVAGVGVLFAFLIYYFRVLDPEEAREQFPGVYAFLWSKWYFDELYSASLVRPAVIVARWCRSFDLRFIDGLIHAVAYGTVLVSRWDRWFDTLFIDGAVNLTGRVAMAVGGQLRGVQTGFLRSYVLFMVLAAVGLFAALSYFVARAWAG